LTNKEHIIILGGGVIGLAVAFELALRHHKVTVIEAGKFGGQATGAAAGMLAPYSEIGEDPDDFFRLCHHSLSIYPEWQLLVKEVARSRFEYTQSGSLHVVFHEADRLALGSRIAWQREWGIRAEIVDPKQLEELEPCLTKEALAAIYYPDEHHLYAPDYVQALQTACQLLGVCLLEHAGEVKISVVNQEGVQIDTQHHQKVVGDQLIVCNGAWLPFMESDFGLRFPVFPIRGQICAYQHTDEQVSHMIFSSQGYMVAKENGSLVCGASEDIAGYDNTVTEKGVSRLIKWSQRLYPVLSEKTPFHRWAGLRPATQDGYPLIGRLTQFPNVIICSGHYRNGILLSPVSAKVVAALINQEKTPVPIQRFSPERFS